MKKLFLFLSFLLLISCKSQNKNMDMLIVDNSLEKFQEISFHRIIQENDLVKRGYLDDESYIEVFYNTNAFKIVLITPKNSYFSIYKEYYNNNNLKSKGLRFNNNNYRDPFKKGIWYEFDESGKLIKETDYDRPFKFTFEDIVKFCEKENIPITKGPVLQSTGFHTMIRRSTENQQPIWEIEWLKKPDVAETIIVDGISGKEISRRESEFINN